MINPGGPGASTIVLAPCHPVMPGGVFAMPATEEIRMTLSDAALTTGATAIKNQITHFQLHSAAPGSSGTTSPVGTRVANTGTVDADGDITWSTIAFTGLTANQSVTHVSYWSASSGGTFLGSAALTGDSAANAAGAYTVTSITETSTAT